MDPGSFLFSFKPIKRLIGDLKHFKEAFNFGELDLAYEIYSGDKNVITRTKLEIVPDLDSDEAIFSWNEPYSILQKKTFRIAIIKECKFIINTLQKIIKTAFENF